MKWNGSSLRKMAQLTGSSALGISVVFCWAGTLSFAADLDHQDPSLQPDGRLSSFVVEIKEHASTNAQNNVNPSQDPSVGSRGDTFVVNGTIYPDNSIPPGHHGAPIVGAPKLGLYVQRGVFTENSDQFLKAVAGEKDVPHNIGFVTEILVFHDGSTLLMDGLWPNASRSTTRVVMGGTGRFSGVVGTVLLENIGEDDDLFCNLRMTFKIRKAIRSGDGR
ncbi:MAG: hypothetical protein ACR2IV_12975 [Bryobacteraceae bacterium]